VPFMLVVEPQEAQRYADRFGMARVHVLAEDNQGLIYARNAIKEHATAAGHARHWQLDDNIRYIERLYHGRRLRCPAAVALIVAEDFTDRYENIALSGLNYHMFVDGKRPPFYLNQRVYSCSLVNNAIPHRWRSVYNDDTDICLQVLADGWCTVLINAFLIEKATTMTVKGGNTKDLYQGDGRLKMARSLERLWPGVVTIDRRFDRPQHVVKDSWRRFDTPLIRKPGIDIDQMEPNEYGMRLQQVKEITSPELRRLLDENQ
jgi:hypothetical protein